ncbi:type III pantothenate kinase [Lysobacter sp. A3-1-A15]|uniref:type III pantothenate kinase n=1 Tax=Novilysobacter viscosus TaxID=3098602 RepID=UPI002EDBA6B5
MSQWVFDLGNSRLKCAPLGADGRSGEVHALAHDGGTWREALDALLPAHIEGAWVASVAAPGLTRTLADALASRAGRVDFVSTQPACCGVRIAYAQPQRLGVDRFLAMIGARAASGGPALLCGVGTALTIDLMDADGLHLGGRIAPSPTLMREALTARVAHLPAIGGTYRDFADDTPDALASGCEGAASALVRDSLALAQEQLGEVPTLYLHGGGAPALLPRLPQARHAPDLVLAGLAAWAAQA